MLKDTKIAFIGGGNMAEAIINGLLSQRTIEPSAIYVADKREERCAFLHAEYTINSVADNSDAISQANIIILAVKPQNLPQLAEEISGIDSSKLIVSILAGIPTQKIQDMLGADLRVVRVMPNTAALVKQAMAGIAGGINATPTDIETVTYIFEQLGKVLVVNESDIDLITGVSGSGPAYVFYFIEAMRDAAIEHGMPKENADLLVTQTFKGALELLTRSNDDPTALRAKVTSKGGTTEQGIAILDKCNVRKIIYDMIHAAVTRSKELSDNA